MFIRALFIFYRTTVGMIDFKPARTSLKRHSFSEKSFIDDWPFSYKNSTTCRQKYLKYSKKFDFKEIF